MTEEAKSLASVSDCAPILFLVFNRPDVTKRVFSRISEVRPSKLYVAADGPRAECNGEPALCNEVRAIVQEVDWDCDVKYLFRKENLGCRRAVSAAIDWFFETEEQGIILEDDCLPSRMFFGFTTKLLDCYSENTEIMHIGGNNFHDQSFTVSSSFYFSTIPHVWGWATWKRAWKYYRSRALGLVDFVSSGAWLSISSDRDIREHWLRCFYAAWSGKVDSWAYLWCFAIVQRRGLSITPSFNLVENIGFSDAATHTKTGDSPKIGTEANCQNMPPLIYPKVVRPSLEADRIIYDKLYAVKGGRRRLFSRLRKRFRNRCKTKSMIRELLNTKL